MFGFIYPGEWDRIPHLVLRELLARVDDGRQMKPDDNQMLCRGTLLSVLQYRADLNRWGYQDARLMPSGPLTETEIEQWTAAMRSELPPTVAAETH